MVDKEIDKIYEAVEVAKATGKLRKGTNETTKAIETGAAKLVIVAKDVTPPEIIMHIPILCKEKGIVCVEVPSREELGAAAGLDLSTSSIAIVQEGEARSIVKELTAKAEAGKEAPKKEEAPKEEKPEEKKEEKPKEEKKEPKKEKAEKKEAKDEPEKKE
ncbi:ribosomal L7Ae/L30e/S12e/Gadd45 family protein [Candidatus Woesearchaeota archaeon]|nr:ribosomal L7Ae/L30e/S12e/Gadd45 family protein [Candidatus Woesearchaeota archaeon]